MLKRGRFAFALALLVGAFDAAAQGTACSKEEATNAEAAASDARSWDALYETFHRFGHCEDGRVAAGFTHSVVWILASRWQDLHDLEHLAEANRSFRAFVLRHIDATADEPDLRRIVATASKCPGHARPICREIERQARAALQELGKD